MNKEMNMQVEIDKLEWEVKRQQDIALTLAEKLNEKIDECEELKVRYESVSGQQRKIIDECEALKAELWRFEAALDRILNNCSVY